MNSNNKNTRIDLHNHTILSDGDYDLFEVCHIKKNIVDCVCITDHFPTYPTAYFEAKDIQTEYYKQKTDNIPELIIGMEYFFNNWVEVLLFGEDLINQVIKCRPKDYKAMNSILNGCKGACVICHPIRNNELSNDTLLNMSDGLEITIRGSFLNRYEKEFKKLQKQYNLNLFSNSDFHSKGLCDWQTHNIIKNKYITNENELILALKENLEIENIYNSKADL